MRNSLALATATMILAGWASLASAEISDVEAVKIAQATLDKITGDHDHPMPTASWRQMKEGNEIRVWQGPADPDAPKAYVFFQVWINAETGVVRTWRLRTE